MATIEEALAQIKRDPVIGFVSIPIIASRNRPTVIVKRKGQSLLLPVWTAREWVWWGKLAKALAAKQLSRTDAGQRDKVLALERFAGPFDAMSLLADSDESPVDERLFPYYDAAVRLVIASQAAATAETWGEHAVASFKAALVEAPRSIIEALRSVLVAGTQLFAKDLPLAAVNILKKLFEDATGLKVPSFASFGTIALIAIGAYFYFNRRHAQGE